MKTKVLKELLSSSSSMVASAHVQLQFVWEAKSTLRRRECLLGSLAKYWFVLVLDFLAWNPSLRVIGIFFELLKCEHACNYTKAEFCWLCLELHVCDLNEFDFEAFEGKLQPHEYAMNHRLLTVELQLLWFPLSNSLYKLNYNITPQESPFLKVWDNSKEISVCVLKMWQCH